ncbi:hypothetical protein KY285_012363 [Solanum tuberosum]|nr:hypothetical protein KY285_012363 [Solanum tuberosum]
MEEAGRPLPKFGEWDVNDPATAEGFTVIFNKARNEKRSGGKADAPPKSNHKHTATLGKPQSWTVLVLVSVAGGRHGYQNTTCLSKNVCNRFHKFAINNLVNMLLFQKKWFCCMRSGAVE